MRSYTLLVLFLTSSSAAAQEIRTATATASSTLTADGMTFKTGHLTDGRLTTWWSPVAGAGPHTLTYQWTNGPATIGALQIHGGSHYPNYPGLGNLYPLNPRVKVIRVGTTPQDLKPYTLTDTDAIQTVVLAQPLVTKQLIIQITPADVYPGSKWKDISISHLALLAPMPRYLPPPMVWQDATPARIDELGGVYLRRDNWFREMTVAKSKTGAWVMSPWSACCDESCKPVTITGLKGRADAREAVPGPEAAQQHAEGCYGGNYLTPDAVRVWTGPVPAPGTEGAKLYDKAIEMHARATMAGFYTWEEQGKWVMIGSHHIQFSGSQPVPYELAPVVTPEMDGIVGFISWGGKRYVMVYGPAVAGPYPRFVLHEARDYGDGPMELGEPVYQLIGPER